MYNFCTYSCSCSLRLHRSPRFQISFSSSCSMKPPYASSDMPRTGVNRLPILQFPSSSHPLREFEQRAANMGGGNFVVPVQIIKDFMNNKVSATTLPSSSYRLGVKAANLHELFPVHITEALQHSISAFDQEVIDLHRQIIHKFSYQDLSLMMPFCME